MAHVVCQVVSRADRLTFIWSEGDTAFEPYQLAAAECTQFDALAEQARTAISRVGSASELARLGHQLYRAAFRLDAADATAARDIAGWLGELHAKGNVESLEFLTDAPGRVPWNVLCDTAPSGEVAWESLWGCRFHLTSGRRTNPLRFAAPLAGATALLAADAALLEQMTGDARAALDAWPYERLVVDQADVLAHQLRSRAPDVLVIVAAVEDGCLVLGGQRVPPAQLQRWLADAREGNPSPIIFLAAAGTPAQTGAWPYWLSAATETLDGLVTYEVPLAANDAARAMLGAAQQFITSHLPIGAVLADVRRALGAVGGALVAFCPPNLRTVDEGAEVAIELPRQPLPDYPYSPLRPFSSEYRPLFVGREEDSLRLAALLDAAGTSTVILHGAPAVGKTSLVQAGLWPYLERECVGYRVLCDRTPDETPMAERDYPALMLRAGRDLIGELADTLNAFCAQPLTWATPSGKTVTVDLPAILATHLGVPAKTAIQAPPAAPLPAEQLAEGIAEPGHGPPPEPEPEPAAGARELWLALREDPAWLARLVDELTRQLPFELVIFIDQAEELITLAQSATECERRRQALEMLMGFAASPARCKFVLLLRTEYYGQLAGLLPDGTDRARWKDYYVEELGVTALADAVLAPTNRDEILYTDETPFTKYRFAFEEGLAQQIVDEVQAEASREQHGTLPLLQVVCAMLYDRQVIQHRQSVIRASDLRASGGVPGAIQRYVANLLFRLGLSSGAREGLRKLIGRLTVRHADGRITRDLVAARELKQAWHERTPVEQAVNTAADQAGLFSVEQHLVAGQPGLYVSLADDAVAQAGKQWAGGRGGRPTRSGVADTLWIMIPLTVLAAALTYFLTQRYYVGAVANERAELETAAKSLQEQFGVMVGASREPLYRAQLAQADQALAADNALAARQLLLSEPFVSIGKNSVDARGFEWDYLWKRANGDRFNLDGHLGTVTSVSVSADGKLAASASLDGTVRLWFAGRGLPAAILQLGKTPLHAVAFAPDGKTVAAAGADKVVRLWDVSAIKDDFTNIDAEPRAFRGHEDAVLALAFDKDGGTLASAGADKTVVLWNVKDGKARATLKDHAARVQALAFAPDGKTLASATADGGVLVWAADSGNKLHALAAGMQSVSAVAFAPDGKKLAIGGAQRHGGVEAGTIAFWDVNGAKPAALPATAQHGRDVLALAYLPGGKALASAGKDAVIRLWDADTAADVGHYVGHVAWVTALAFSRDAATLVSGGYDRSVKVWDTGQIGGAQVLRGHKGWVQAVAFNSPAKDQQWLASGGADGVVKLWDAVTGAPVAELTGHNGPVTSVAFSLKKLRLAVGTFPDKGDGEVKVWDLSRDEKSGRVAGKEVYTLKGHTAGVTCVAFTLGPGEELLASGSADKTAVIWDLKTGKSARTLVGHTAEVRCLSWSADSSLLFTGSADQTVRAWDTKTGQSDMFKAHTDAVEAIDFLLMESEDGRIPGVLTAGLDHLIRLWAPSKDDFVPRTTVRAPGQPITCMVRLRNSLFTGGWDGTVKLWSLEPRQTKPGEPTRVEIRERFTFAGHTGPIRAVAFSLDQTVMASASHDGTVRLWRASPVRFASAPRQKE